MPSGRENMRPPASKARASFTARRRRRWWRPRTSFYREQSDLMIVCLEEGHLTSQLTYEPAVRVGDERAGVLFPHIYGPLNLEAVSEVYQFPCDAEGRFVLPSALNVA